MITCNSPLQNSCNNIKYNVFQKTESVHKVKMLDMISCCIFPPAFGCCAPQTLVEIVIFSIFMQKAEKIFKKVTNFIKISAFLPKQCWKWLFPPAFEVCSTQTLVEVVCITYFNILNRRAHYQFLLSCFWDILSRLLIKLGLCKVAALRWN